MGFKVKYVLCIFDIFKKQISGLDLIKTILEIKNMKSCYLLLFKMPSFKKGEYEVKM